MTKKVAARITTPLLEAAIKDLAFENQALVVGTFAELAKGFSKLRKEKGYPATTISGMRYQLPDAFKNTGAAAHPAGPIWLPISDDLLIELVARRFGEEAAECLRATIPNRLEESDGLADIPDTVPAGSSPSA